MLSHTLQEGLDRYCIGEKIRALRLRKKLGLVELGKHTGLSPALLSKLERGRIFPTLPTLLRISLVFSVGLDYFFTEDRRRQALAVVRCQDRREFPERPGGRKVAFHFESLDFPALEKKLNAFLARFEPISPEKVRYHQHAGGEFIFVLGGKLGLHFRDREVVLEKQDSVYFDSGLPHGYRRIGRTACTAVVVTVE